MATSAERQRRLRERRAGLGLVPVTIFVPAATQADFKQAAEACCGDKHLTLRIVCKRTGRVVARKGKKPT